MNISTASTYDYVSLNAHIKDIYNNTCDVEANYIRNRFNKYDDCESRVKSFRKAKGCNAILNRVVDRIDNIEFKTCTCSIKHPLTNSLLRISNLMDKGHLPYGGSIMDQPSQIMELLEIVDHAKNREIAVRKERMQKGNING